MNELKGKQIVLYYVDRNPVIERSIIENKTRTFFEGIYNVPICFCRPIERSIKIDIENLDSDSRVKKVVYNIEDLRSLETFLKNMQYYEFCADYKISENGRFLKADLYDDGELVNTLYNYFNYYYYGKNNSLLDDRIRSPHPRGACELSLCFTNDDKLYFLCDNSSRRALNIEEEHLDLFANIIYVKNIDELFMPSDKIKEKNDRIQQEEEKVNSLDDWTRWHIIKEKEETLAKYKKDWNKLLRNEYLILNKLKDFNMSVNNFFENHLSIEDAFKDQEVVLDDNFIVYEEEIKEMNSYTSDEINSLIDEYKKGNEDSLNKIIASKLKTVVEIVKLYSNNGVDASDLLQEGNIALVKTCKGLKKYNISTDSTLNNHIYKNVTKSIVDYLLSRGKQLVFTPEIYYYLECFKELNLEEIYDNFSDRLNYVKEVANYLDIDLNESVWACSLLSLDKDALESTIEYELYDDLSIEDEVMKKLMGDSMPKLLDVLDDHKRKIIDMYYGLEGYESHTISDIAKELNCSRTAVNQIITSGVKKMVVRAKKLELHLFLEK